MNENTVKAHYDQHLETFYAWMVGDFDQKQREQEHYFAANNLAPQQNQLAVDLGAGHGLQAVSLARLGYTVKAIDFNKRLLQELDSRRQHLPIELIEADLLNFTHYVTEAELIVCMGDTIAHLTSESELSQLLRNICQKLLPGGKLVLSFRDYGQELTDTQRFIPVKADDTRILTCILEYFPEQVRVTDLLYEKTANGWEQKISSYFKIRLNQSQVQELLHFVGFTVIKTETIMRMVYLIAQKPI